jgi:hypothetical protein
MASKRERPSSGGEVRNGKNPLAPAPAAGRVWLTRGAEVAFFGCYSILLGVAALIGAAIAMQGIARLLPPDLGPYLVLLSLLVFPVVTVLLLWKTIFHYVEVGADGVVLRRRWKGKSFVPYRDVLDVREGQGMGIGTFLIFELRDGSQAGIRIDTLGARRQAALVARIVGALRDYRKAQEKEDALEPLARRGQPIEAWRTSIEQSVQGQGYRKVRIAPEVMARTLGNVAETRERRIGAALALTAANEADARAHIEEAARVSADARLRIALTSIAEGEIDAQALEEALAADEAEGRATR